MLRYHANGVGDQYNAPLGYSSNRSGWGAELAPFLGRPRADLGGAQRSRMVDINDMPDAYDGRAQYLGSVVQGLAIIDQTYLTAYVLPMEMNDNIEYQWNEFSFDQTLPTIVPHQGVPRVVKHGRQSKKAFARRKGIAAHFENDFLKTSDGVEMYVRTMRQIALAIQRAIEIDVFAALLEANEDEKDWQAKHGFIMQDWRDKMEREIQQYAWFSKDCTGFERWIDDIFATARINSWEPNMVIINQECRALYKFGHAERYLYMFAGPQGAQRWMAGPRSFGTFRDLAVFEAPAPNAYASRDDIPVVRAPITIGEWVPFVDKLRDTPTQKRHARDRNQQIYDETVDAWHEVSFAQAVRKCHRFDENGELHSKHWELAESPSNMDIFIARNKYQRSYVTRWFGQVEDNYIDERSMKMMVGAARAQLSPQQQDALDYLYTWFLRTRDEPISRAFLALLAGEDGGNAAARGAGVAALPMGRDLLMGGNALADAYRADTHHDWANADMVERTCYLARVQVHGSKLDACPVKKLHTAPGEFASWFGVELWSERDPRLSDGITAARQLYKMCLEAFGGTRNPVLNPVNCPRHLKRVVREENRGLCTFMERTVFSGVAPLVYVGTPTAEVAVEIPKSYIDDVGALMTSYAEDANRERLQGMQDRLVSCVDELGLTDRETVVDVSSKLLTLILAASMHELEGKRGRHAVKDDVNLVVHAQSYFLSLVTAALLTLRGNAVRIINKSMGELVAAVNAALPRTDAIETFDELTSEDGKMSAVLGNDTARAAIIHELADLIDTLILTTGPSSAGNAEAASIMATIAQINLQGIKDPYATSSGSGRGLGASAGGDAPDDAPAPPTADPSATDTASMTRLQNKLFLVVTAAQRRCSNLLVRANAKAGNATVLSAIREIHAEVARFQAEMGQAVKNWADAKDGRGDLRTAANAYDQLDAKFRAFDWTNRMNAIESDIDALPSRSSTPAGGGGGRTGGFGGGFGGGGAARPPPPTPTEAILLPFVCHSIPAVSVGLSGSAKLYAPTIWICDPRTGFTTHFCPADNETYSPTDAEFDTSMNRIPSPRWTREGASVDSATMPDASAYEGSNGFPSGLPESSNARGGGSSWLPLGQQTHDADRTSFSRAEIHGSSAMGGEVAEFADSPAFKARYERAVAADTLLDLAIRFAFMFVWINERNMVEMAECAWCVKPWGYLMVMPRDTHEMGGALALRGGPELGRTYIGHVDTKRGENAVHKTLILNVTFYHVAVVKESKMVVRSDFLHYLRYIGGHNSRAATSRELEEWAAQDFGPPRSRDEWSVIFFLVPHTETFDKDKFIDLRGYPVDESRRNFYQDNNRADPHYSTHAYYNHRFGFREMPPQDYGVRLYVENACKPNSLCVRGPWCEFNPSTGEFSKPYKNQGHHGPDVVPGETGAIRNGMAFRKLKDAVSV